MFDQSLEELMFDQVTIEPWVSQDSNQSNTYGTSVTYTAQVIPSTQKVTNAQGDEVVSTAQVIIKERLYFDHRARLTLPSGFVPQQPPIQKIEPVLGLGMDHTRIWL